MRSRSLIWLVSIALILSLALAGCGGSAPQKPEQGETTQGTEQTQQTQQSTQSSGGDTASKKGLPDRFFVGLSQDGKLSVMTEDGKMYKNLPTGGASIYKGDIMGIYNSSDRFYIVTRDNILVYDKDMDKLIANIDPGKSLSDTQAITPIGGGVVVVTAYDYLVVSKDGKLVADIEVSIADDKYTQIDGKNRLWAWDTDSGNIDIYDLTTGQKIKSINPGAITALVAGLPSGGIVYSDNEYKLWMLKEDGGKKELGHEVTRPWTNGDIITAGKVKKDGDYYLIAIDGSDNIYTAKMKDEDYITDVYVSADTVWAINLPSGPEMALVAWKPGASPVHISASKIKTLIGYTSKKMFLAPMGDGSLAIEVSPGDNVAGAVGVIKLSGSDVSVVWKKDLSEIFGKSLEAAGLTAGNGLLAVIGQDSDYNGYVAILSTSGDKLIQPDAYATVDIYPKPDMGIHLLMNDDRGLKFYIR